MDNNFIYYQNVRGLKSKVNEFYRNVLVSDFEIISLTETWLDESVYCAELFTNEWSVFRQDGRVRARGRGVLVAVRDSVWRADPLPYNVDDDNVSVLWLKLSNQSGFSFYLCTVYISPNSNLATYESFFQSLENRFFINDRVMIIGDFNLPLITNSQFNFGSGGELYLIFKNFLQFYNFHLFNDIVNSNNKTLDLVISNLSSIKVVRLDDFLVPIDNHHPVLSVGLSVSKGKWRVAPPNEVNYNFSKVNFHQLYVSFREASWDRVMEMSNVEESVACFYEVFYSCLNQHTSKRTRRISKYPSWYNNEIISNIKRKDKYRKLYKRSRSLLHLENFKRCRAVHKRLVRQSYDHFLQVTEEFLSTDPKRFWSFINSKKVSKLNPSSQRFVFGNAIFEDGLSAAEGFARYFGSIYDDGEYLDLDVILNSPVMSGVQSFFLRSVSEDQVAAAIRKLPSKRSFGPDLIPVYIIKGCSEFLIKPLCHIFNLCLAQNCFPVSWKVTKITPIFKRGNRFEIPNYRPVAISNTPAKVFELIIFDHVFSHMKQYISPQQHGFMPSRSINTNLVNFVNFTSLEMDSRHQVDVVYTDMSKAFDKVSHILLLKKMNYYGFSSDLIRFFISYLNHRRQFVSFYGYKSDTFLAASGVPQGSNLGPLCFNIFINDLSLSLSCNHLMYADDLKLFLPVKCLRDCDILQNDLDSLYLWCSQNKLNLNISKCCTMSFYRILSPIVFPYNIDGCVLVRVDKFRDLGVIMTSDLRFSEHIAKMVNKAYGTLGFITRTCKLFHDPVTFITLYKSLVRSKLEFASPVWSPHSALFIEMIEKIQKRFLRTLYFKVFGIRIYPVWVVRYRELLHTFKFHRLDVRRKAASLCFLKGVMTGSIDDSELLAGVPWHVPRRGGRISRMLYLGYARTVGHATSPMLLAFQLMNTVADHVDITWSVNKFKSKCLEIICNDL